MSGQPSRISGLWWLVAAGAVFGAVALGVTAWLAGHGLGQGDSAPPVLAQEKPAAEQPVGRVDLEADAGAVLWTVGGPAGRTAPPPAKGADLDVNVQSLRPRLAYEAKKTTAPKLSQDSANRLASFETMLARERRSVLRAVALSNLHDKSVRDFASTEGFGMERTIFFTPKYLELPEAPPITLAAVSDSLSEAEAGESVRLPAGDLASGRNPFRLPSLNSLASFHLDGQQSFVNLAGFGFVPRGQAEKKSPPLQLAFKPHQFRHLPELLAAPAKDVKERWLVARLELVSLLKHEKPVAYVSKHLPRMDELRGAPTRSLDGFEERALVALRSGEPLVTEAALNRIYMVGAVRAATQCLDCHRVQRGALLGAFSYDLRRTPPLKAQKAS